MRKAAERIIAAVVAVLMIAAVMPAKAVQMTFNTRNIPETDTVEKSGAELSAEADTFWDDLKDDEINIKSESVSDYMKKAYELVESTGEARDIEWEDEDTFSFTLSNGVPCIYDYKIRQIELSIKNEGLDETVVTDYGTNEKANCTNSNVVLFGPYYGYDSSFQSDYRDMTARIVQEKGGTSTIYSGTNATPALVREHVAQSGNAVIFFDSHGISQNSTSYFCMRSSTGISSSDYSNHWAVSLSGAYGIDGRYMTNGSTVTVDGTFCWFAICEGMMTQGICAPLRTCGASVVYGYSQSVSFTKDYQYMNVFWPYMLQGATVAEAAAAMKSQYGNYDNYVSPRAYPVFVSDEDAYPSNPDAVQTVNTTWKLMGESYKLTYDANGGTGAPAMQDGNTEYTVSTTIPVNFPKTFKGWAKTNDAQAAEFLPGAEITLEADTTLYAVWSEPLDITYESQYSITLDFAGQTAMAKIVAAEGLDGEYTFESIGSNDTQIQLYDEAGTVLASADDGGSTYNFLLNARLEAGKTYYIGMSVSGTLSGSFTLKIDYYPDYMLTYDANGGADAPEQQNWGMNHNVSSSIPNRVGFNFLGWAKTADATEPEYLPNDSIELIGDTVIYAVWKEGEAAELGETSVTPGLGEIKYFKFTAPVSGKYIIDSNIGGVSQGVYIMELNGDYVNSEQPSTEHVLVGGTTYYVGVVSGEGTLTITKVTYTITYVGNGASNIPEAEVVTEEAHITTEQPHRFQYTFNGWSTTEHSNTAEYLPGGEINVESDITLYAVWTLAEDTLAGEPSENVITFANQTIFRQFTPEHKGVFTFTVNSDKASIIVYDFDGNVIAESNKDGASVSVACELRSNKTYFISISYNDDSIGTLSLLITPENMHTVTFVSADGTVIGSIAVADGESVEEADMPEAPEKEGYVFVGYEYSGEAVTDDITITAKYCEMGDANADGVINAGDAVLVLRHCVGLVEIEGTTLQLADINDDGEINIGDAVAILRRTVGL